MLQKTITVLHITVLQQTVMQQEKDKASVAEDSVADVADVAEETQ